MPTTQKYNLKKVAWDKFNAQLASDTEDNKEQWNELILHNTIGNLEVAAKALINTINKATDSHTLLHNISPRSKPWWTAEFTITRRHMNTPLKEWRTN